MPADLPVELPVEVTDRAGSSIPAPWLWDVFFVMVATSMVAAILLDEGSTPGRRYVALGALAAMVVLHLVVGHQLITRERESTASLVVSLVQMAFFAVTVAAVPVAAWLLFAMIPLLFQMVSLRRAIVLVVLVNLIPVATEQVNDPGGIGMDLVVAAISTGAGICMGLWIMRMVEQSKERASLIAELEASRAELARLSHEAGVAAERTRLAGEIHDTLAQGFTSIITLIQAADPALRDERLALAVRTAKENLAESREIIAAFSPAALASGLLDSVRRQASRFAEEASVPATFRTTGEPRDLPTAVEVVLLRAAQEALTNVRRHAGANEVAVLLAYAPDTVRLVVRDDGRGFDPRAAGGYGLPGMRSRVEQVGGVLTIRSDADTGTTIEVEVPA
ncbi:sensor histidine kinase [Actinoplanes rectilineatus]|uniref:sensor histidine kinase n=1 Tax=Actinoplanes rectilineatus TaxID=113571 RepID=UPI001FDF81B5|nr:sensor histidine kinase [Actinoplanes rectilineatus]